MWDINSLFEYYKYVFVTQGPTPLTAKLSLAVALYVVAAGNEKPGQKLLTAVFATHMAVAAWLALGQSISLHILLVALAVLAAAVHALRGDPFRWIVLPESQGMRTLAIAGYAVAFVLPLWPYREGFAQVFWSPMGTLPHQSLAALLVLCAVSISTRPVYLHGAAAAGAVVLAVGDLLAGYQLLAGAMVLFAAASFAPLVLNRHLAESLREEKERLAQMASARRAGGDPPPAEKNPRPGRKWNIK